MRRWWLGAALGAGAAIAVLAIVLLARDNARLRSQLAAARAVGAAQVSVDPALAGRDGAPAGAPASGRANLMGLVGTLGRAISDRPADGPGADAGPAPVDWEARRAERQQRLRDLLGRRPGESDDAYRARVAPLVKTVLALPRDRLDERRRQFEEAAGVSSEQKAKLDAAFQEASAEVIGLANTAIAGGDLTPYQRNSRGVLAFVGSTVGTVDALDQRLRQILTAEQQAIMDESGFDPLEYLGVSSPWETLNPPPPPPSPRSANGM